MKNREWGDSINGVCVFFANKRILFLRGRGGGLGKEGVQSLDKNVCQKEIKKLAFGEIL